MSISTDDLGRITQQTAVTSSDGDKLGAVNQVYTSDTTGEPAWVTVKTGLFGTQESFVPLADAAFEGDDIRVPVTKQQVHDAPRVDADGHLSVEEEDDLYRYYGVHNPGHPGDGQPGSEDRDTSDARSTNDVRDTDDTRDTRDTNDVRDLRDTDDGDASGGSASGAHAPGADRGHGAEVGAGAAGAAGTAAALADRDRDDDLAQRDVEGRDEVADRPDVEPRRAQDVDAGGSGAGGQRDDDVKPGERTTQLRRYVVTERVVRTVEELPEDEPRG